MTMVTSPAWGMPAAPMLAAVAVMLQRGGERRRREKQEGRLPCWDPRSKEVARMPAPLGPAKRGRSR